MCKILVFAGTTEGYHITEYLLRHNISVHMCAATRYGSARIPQSPLLTVSKERMNEEAMVGFLEKNTFAAVVDGTHPYAVEVTKNIRSACQRTGTDYLRIVRPQKECRGPGDVVTVGSTEEAVEYLEGTRGNILVTTGSKELHKFTKLTGYEQRIYARVLSLLEVAAHCSQLGFEGQHLICMQGPFSRELNCAMLKQYNCSYLVTKETGNSGGFLEKYQAACEADATLLVIGRPEKETGLTLMECKKKLQSICGFVPRPRITLVGIGMGAEATFTVEGRRACRQADVIIGGKRLADSAAFSGQPTHYEYAPQKIKEYIVSHPQYEQIVIALSGDVGFYSGAKKLRELLGREIEVICGISSLAYFMSRIQLSWEDAAIVSAHGRNCNLIHYGKTKEKTFAILGTEDGVRKLAQKLVHYNMEDITLYVGENLSYPEEVIRKGSPKEFVGYQGSSLSVVCMVNEQPIKAALHLRDEEFLRGKVPMTKEEVRSLSVDKLRLTPDAVCYDVGAGTGSVTMEMALQSYNGKVYAIEKKEEAITLLEQNKQHLIMDHVEIICGIAPGAMTGLEPPTHAFIGGSSGNLKEIMEELLRKNPRVRMVINCIALETVAEALACLRRLPVENQEIVQVSIGKAKEVGDYHMMMGENPIYIISCEGRA